MNPTYGEYNSATNNLPVYLEGKIVGNIRAHAWGWHFVPTNSISGGITYATIGEVKNALQKSGETESSESSLVSSK
jgi:hypothetical protein